MREVLNEEEMGLMKLKQIFQDFYERQSNFLMMKTEYRFHIWAVFKTIAATLAASLGPIESTECTCIIACYC